MSSIDWTLAAWTSAAWTSAVWTSAVWKRALCWTLWSAGALATAQVPSPAPAPAPTVRAAPAREEPKPEVGLAATRELFNRLDSNHDAKLDPSELAAGKFTPEEIALGDRGGDRTLTWEEFVGGYPLVLARRGQRAASDLESEALRVRTPAPARSGAEGAAGGERLVHFGGARRASERGEATLGGSAPSGQNGASGASSSAGSGPAAARLRTAPGSEEAEKRIQAARAALDQRLRDAHSNTIEPRAPDGASGANGADKPRDLSELRLRAAGTNTSELDSAEKRIRAAREALDARIRAARGGDAEPPKPAPPGGRDAGSAPTERVTSRDGATERQRAIEPPPPGAPQPVPTPRREGGDARAPATNPPAAEPRSRPTAPNSPPPANERPHGEEHGGGSPAARSRETPPKDSGKGGG